jgi:hypothetical protein
MLRPENVYT